MRAVLFIPVFIGVSLAARAQSSGDMRQADRLYKEKKYPEALAGYQKALEADAKDPVVNYNLGDAYFRNDEFGEAAKAFDIPLAGGNAPVIRQRAFYNKGVSLFKQSKLEESIEAYKNALLLDPDDNDARTNLQKTILELKKKQNPEKNEKQDDKNNKRKEKDSPPQPQSKLTKKQVEQLLKALDQREQQVQQKMQQNRSRSVNKPEKDW